MAEVVPELLDPQLSDASSVDINYTNTAVDGGAIVEKLSCDTCGACCRAGITIDLSDPEASMLRSAGTVLVDHSPSKHEVKPRRNTRRYLLASDCGNLVVDSLTGHSSCQAYENRPNVCRDFPVGSYACRSLRADNGVDSPVAFYEYRQRTAQG